MQHILITRIMDITGITITQASHLRSFQELMDATVIAGTSSAAVGISTAVAETSTAAA